ncbi:hypothetical protein GCM10017567_00130 [Amycolatopsis bullii]|uniref:Uncharacterized protein n=1 Tax=Amycolatopsis bullii TaxID=941987 RepID=A0ABQ3JWS2_9PSEU|nr:hypothetical protein GCM10017567_00130 [Amycolatopsis bullii]
MRQGGAVVYRKREGAPGWPSGRQVRRARVTARSGLIARRPDGGPAKRLSRREEEAARWPSREEAATGPVLHRGTGRAEH